MPSTDFTAGLDAGIGGMRIGYVSKLPGIEIDWAIRERLDDAAAVLSGLGAHIEEITLDLSGVREMIEVIWSVGCATLVEEIADNEEGTRPKCIASEVFVWELRPCGRCTIIGWLRGRSRKV